MATFVLDPAIHTTASVPRSFKPPPRRQYRDKQYQGGETEWQQRLERSTTVYVGNLSCYTTEYQIYELFSRCGSIKRIIMGLDKFKKTPCGFCFVEFDDRDSAMRCCTFLNRNLLDNRELQIDIDAGFKEGRQFGRGTHGGQVGDERRREREQQRPVEGAGGGPLGGRLGVRPGSPSALMTRSITIVACMAILLTILHVPQPAESSFVILSSGTANQLQYVNAANIRKMQATESRAQFEKNLANFLVNLLKTAKPTLLQAFIKATLADKQLREIAISLFFSNSTPVDDAAAR